ncbi:MAG: hypothetical protein IT423_05320, partial [Pirellulaceae bacterium]|nr:hypothetical protein [Pirellulaceae bacterium]
MKTNIRAIGAISVLTVGYSKFLVVSSVISKSRFEPRISRMALIKNDIRAIGAIRGLILILFGTTKSDDHRGLIPVL